MLQQCSARLGTTQEISSSDMALCRAADGQPIISFDEMRNCRRPLALLMNGAAWRAPPPRPAATSEVAYDASLLGALEGVTRVEFDDPELPALLRAAVPLVISNAPLIDATLRRKWLEGDYLQSRLDKQSNSKRFSVMAATPGIEPPRFAYHDFEADACRNGRYVVHGPPKGPTSMRHGNFEQFSRWREAEGERRFYLQTTLVNSVEEEEMTPQAHKPRKKQHQQQQKKAEVPSGVALFSGERARSDCVGELLSDIRSFDWRWLNRVMAHRPQGRPYHQSQLFVGGSSGVTPLHYDTYDNLLVQVSGVKRVLMLSPDQYDRCYPYPHNHPQDRQSRVQLDKVDLRRFPRWRGAIACEAELQPGDVLHLPPCARRCSWLHA